MNKSRHSAGSAPSRRGHALPASLQRRLDEAGRHIARDAMAQALAALTPVLEHAPSHPDGLRLLGLILMDGGQPHNAIEAFHKALETRPDDAALLNNLGSALRSIGRIEEAQRTFEHACSIAPGLAASWYNLGKLLRSERNFESAGNALERAVSADPGHVAARVMLGEVLKTQGELERAIACFEEAIQRFPAAAGAWYALANLKTYRFSAAQTGQLARLCAKPMPDADTEISLRFALAKAQEDQGDHQAAFDTLLEANRLKRDHVRWDRHAFDGWIDSIAGAFDAITQSPLDATLGEEVIFIISLPRSGSTLVEQILAAHPAVDAGEELPDLAQVVEAESARRAMAFPQWARQASADDWHRLGLEYLERTRGVRRTGLRFTDKGLSNWPLVGAAALMLPGARFVNCRRDPIETCFSCFRQLFARSHEYSYDLNDLAAYWQAYARLSAHWTRLLPRRFFEHRHEDLLDAPSRRTTALLADLELPFDVACLSPHVVRRDISTASAAQVRRPIARTISHDLGYGAVLAPLREALRAAALS